MNQNFLYLITSLFLVSISADARPPMLSDSEKQCVESKVGDLSNLRDMDRDERMEVFKNCGVKPKEKHHKPFGDLSEDQRECLHSQLGEPNRDQRPSKEDMQAALSQCGIELSMITPPALNSEEQLNDVIADYELAEEDEKRRIEELLKRSFYDSEDEDFKSKIREFLVSNIKKNQFNSPGGMGVAPNGTRSFSE